mmetsp:Transcript_19626/g.47275  ORF Transcript_19626/g.47275 Transcript_19626/m.47275 type:complete len:283 (-) Transcript_19626:418-1266(-)
MMTLLYAQLRSIPSMIAHISCDLPSKPSCLKTRGFCRDRKAAMPDMSSTLYDTAAVLTTWTQKQPATVTPTGSRPALSRPHNQKNTLSNKQRPQIVFPSRHMWRSPAGALYNRQRPGRCYGSQRNKNSSICCRSLLLLEPLSHLIKALLNGHLFVAAHQSLEHKAQKLIRVRGTCRFRIVQNNDDRRHTLFRGQLSKVVREVSYGYQQPWPFRHYKMQITKVHEICGCKSIFYQQLAVVPACPRPTHDDNVWIILCLLDVHREGISRELGEMLHLHLDAGSG